MCVNLILDIASKKAFDLRCDGSPFCPYPSPTRFGVNKERFTFKSKNNTLVGYRYFLNKNGYKAKVIFFHGFGAGHTAYSKEISEIAKQGYLVYSFDYTGCMESEGENIISLAQAVLDMGAFFDYLAKNDDHPELETYSIGHSWGGFISLLALDKKYNVSKAISLAGMPSVSYAFIQKAPFLAKKKKQINKYIAKRFSPLASKDAFEVALESNKPFLYIQGDLDEILPYKDCLVKFEKMAKENKNAHFLTVSNRHHQPYYDMDACNYFNELFFKKHIGDPNHSSDVVIDESRLFKDDKKVMKSIFDFFSNKD